ncbi:MAG: ferrichrome ABC transporter permease [Anaerolineae bacterium]|nr:ferrichrome ABC transporter permease [Anaerolineae bacterium]
MTRYKITIFTSAFLLFLVQPLMGKVLLPWFGGGSAVWTTVMLFFQVLLLAGYIYSHLLTGRLAYRQQVIIHFVLVGLSLLGLGLCAIAWPSPLTPGVEWKPHADNAPIPHILLLLSVSVGLPYFVLSTSSPLLQTWSREEEARERGSGGAGERRINFGLYALSNLGSLLGLLCYPILLEPFMAIVPQAYLWAGGYAGFAIGIGLVGHQFIQYPPTPKAKKKCTSAAVHHPQQHPTLVQAGLWLGFSTCASVLLLAATNHITQDVAPVPFLWVLPLALYLLSYILMFGWKNRDAHWTVTSVGLLLAFFLATLVYSYILIRGNTLSIRGQLGGYLFVFFIGCLICNGETVRFQPAPIYLTAFYLILALGGALGGFFVNLAVPWISQQYDIAVFWELPLGICACWGLFWLALKLDATSPLHGKFATPAGLLLAIAITTAVMVPWYQFRIQQASLQTAYRNFYGVLRVQTQDFDTPSPDGAPWGEAFLMTHGSTLHGLQYTSPDRRGDVSAYYGPTSGIGRVMLAQNDAPEGQRVGILGLGVGALAGYGRAGDIYRFYEINPDVIALAKGEGSYFSYLTDTAAQIDIIPGDARLSLEREWAQDGSQQYTILVLDVFSSDSIPIHLLTKESFDLYLAHLVEDGVLAIHISTGHLNLETVLAELAAYFDLQGIVIEDSGGEHPCCRSKWAILRHSEMVRHTPEFLAWNDILTVGSPLTNNGKKLRLWTDDYSNLLQILQ